MGITRAAVLTALITSIFLLSCEAPLDFEEPDEKSVTLEVETVAPGSFHRSGDAVPISLTILEGDADPSRIDFSLNTGDGVSLASSSYELEGVSSLPDLELPEVEPGLYILESSVYDAEEGLLYRGSTRFFIVAGDYAIRRISTLPVSVEPGSDVLLVAVVDAPEGSSPYLAWRIGNDIIYEGTAETETVKAHWRAPDVEGVYSLEVELFPFPPGGLDDFRSPAALETDVYVSRSTAALKGDLGPPENYANLFHLRGNFKDEGYAGGNGIVEESGNPLFDVKNNLYGLRLEGSSGVVFPEIEPPPFGREPFSLVVRMLAEGHTDGGRLLRYMGPSGGTVFSVIADGKGELRGRYDSSGISADIPSGIFPTLEGEPITVVLSAYPAEEGIDWYWYLDGKLTGMYKTSTIPAGPVSSLELGGGPGMTGIIDEVGLHTRNGGGRPAALEEPFAMTARERYGSAVRYAEGFGEGQPSDMAVRGTVEFSRGRALLTPEASLILPPVGAGGERISLGLYLPEGRGSLRVEYSFGGSEIVSQAVGAGDGGAEPDEDGYVWIDLSSESAETGELSVRLENGSSDAPLVLGAIILLSERTELTDKTESEEISAIS